MVWQDAIAFRIVIAPCRTADLDSFVSPEITTAEQRQKSFTDMMKVALGAEY